MNEWMEKPLPDLAFYISLVRENFIFAMEKSGILKWDICGNLVLNNFYSSNLTIFSGGLG